MRAIFLLAGLFAASASQAQTVQYDFTAYLAGIGAGGPVDGSFDYQNGAILDAEFQGVSYAGMLTNGNTVLTLTGTSPNGMTTLTANLFAPMHGQTDSTEALTATFSGGGSDGWCGGSGFCNAPLEFIATKINAPELNAGGAATCVELLLAGLLMIGGKRAARNPNR